MSVRAAALRLLLFTIIVLEGAAGIASPPKPRDTEEKLLARLQQENNPVKKAKLEVRLGRLKLDKAFDAYGRGDFEPSRKQLDAYLARMESAWATLSGSGRDASKKPDGFKELDIALRESRRVLEDFETRVTYEERPEVEKIRQQTEELQNRVLNALFPPAPAQKKKARFAGGEEITSTAGRAQE